MLQNLYGCNWIAVSETGQSQAVAHSGYSPVSQL